MPQIVDDCAAYIEQCHHLSARDPVQMQEIPDKSWGDTIQWDTGQGHVVMTWVTAAIWS